MNKHPRAWAHLVQGAVAAACVTLIVACGGGGGGGSGVTSTSTAGVGSGGTGFVTGFGSVIVDGIRYDDSRLDASGAIEVEADDSSTATGDRTVVKVGQRVELTFDTGDIATKLRVASEAVGLVTQVAAGNEIQVAGQRVVVNTSSTAGPLTIFEGFTALASLTTNDRVEVHGVLRTDNSGSQFIQAARIELKPTTNSAGVAITSTKVSGFVSNLATSNGVRTFNLGTLVVTVPANASVTPTAATLANGNRVKVFSAGPVANNALTASAVRIKQFNTSQADFRVFGVVSNANATTNTFQIENVTVDASSIGSVPANGTSVRVKGVLNADTNTLVAKEVKVSDDTVTGNELKGSVADYVSNASFTVRGTPVDASAATITGTLAQGVFVEIKGTVQNGVVKASTVNVKASPDDGSQLEIASAISGLNTSTKTFTLNNTAVSYTTSTTFDNGTESALANGVQVKVEGRLVSNVLQARSIEFRDAASELETQGVLRANATANGSTVTFVLNNTSFTCTKDSNKLAACDTATLKSGVKVEVKYVQSNGVNVAKRLNVQDK